MKGLFVFLNQRLLFILEGPGVWNFHKPKYHRNSMALQNSVPKVGVIGTCRVHHTTRELARIGKIALDNGGMGTFVHTPPEILLRLQVMLGMKRYTGDLVKLQVGKAKELKLAPNDGFSFEHHDVVIIEVSSLKTIFAFDQPLQLNEVNRHMCTPFGAFGKEIMANINASFNGRLPRVQNPAGPFPEDYPPEYETMVENLEARVLTKEDIFSYLQQILELLDVPVLFVNHINIEGKDGKLLTSRNRLCRFVQEFCNLNGDMLYEPAKLFETKKRSDLLMKQGADLNHYATESLLKVGMDQLDTILQAMES